MELSHAIGLDELQQQVDDGIDFTPLLGVADLAGLLVAAELVIFGMMSMPSRTAVSGSGKAWCSARMSDSGERMSV